jgi:hypothetical protein
LSFLARTLASGAAAAVASAAVAALCSRVENRHAARPLNAVAHIYDGGAPPERDGPGHRNTFIGLALHAGASMWWAAFFEGLWGRLARRSTPSALLGGAAIAASAYVRFERFLSARSMFAVYAALAAGLALGSRLGRLGDHQVEDRDERDERRHAEARPEDVIAPELLGQRSA